MKKLILSMMFLAASVSLVAMEKGKEPKKEDEIAVKQSVRKDAEKPSSDVTKVNEPKAKKNSLLACITCQSEK